MILNSNATLSETEIKKLGAEISEVAKNLSVPNPEYLQTLRFGKFYKKVEKELCYLRETKNGYVLPRYYFSDYSRCNVTDNSCVGKKLHGKSKITLREYQKNFFAENGKSIEEHTGVLIEAACGSGKTVLGIYIAFMRNVRTIIVVPTYYLAKQWQTRIEQFSTSSVFIFDPKTSSVPLDRDFYVIVTSLFTVRTMPKELTETVGHVIMDESHRMGADTYMPILDEIPARYRTSLTATFRREDGLHKILHYHFGEYYQMACEFPKPEIYSIATKIALQGVLMKGENLVNLIAYLEAENLSYSENKCTIGVNPHEVEESVLKGLKSGSIKKTKGNNILSLVRKAKKLNYSTVDTYLNADSKRRKLVISMIHKALENGRTVLFLSKRKDILKTLGKVFSSYRPVVIISETAERTPEQEVYLQNECRLVLGVTQLAKEGLDIDRLDTLIIHLPIKDTEQAIGRISRIAEGKKKPVVLYLLDKCPVTYATFNNAKKFFKINGVYKGETTVSMLDWVLK